MQELPTEPVDVLVIDDDEELGELLVSYLERHHLEAFAVNHPREGLAIVARTPPRIVILDLMLPDIDGFETCRQIRTSSDVPIIMLTARHALPDRIAGLRLGADDYLAKPFEPEELLLRIRAILRRSQAIGLKDDDGVAELALDSGRQTASMHGEPLELTDREFQILAFLHANQGRVVSREEIHGAVKGIDWDGLDRTIDVLVSRLRGKLGDDAKMPRFIKTIWGRGYLFLDGDSQ